MLKNFRSYNLAVEFYKATRDLGAPNGLRDQLGRASSSIALNLAEGSAKTSRKDRRRFYEIALGSTRECEAIMDLIDAPTEVKAKLDAVAASVYALCRALKS